MRTRASILFLFRKPKNAGELTPDTSGTIVCRITVRGKHSTISTYIRTPYGKWNAAASRLVGPSVAVKQANETIVQMRNELTDLAADLNRQKKPVTAKRLQQLYWKGDGASAFSLVELFAAFIAERKTLVGLELSPANIVQHKTRYNKLAAFLATQQRPDLRPEEFTYNMADRLLHWLLTALHYKRNSANNVLKTVSQVLRWGVRREHLDKNPLELYKLKMAAANEIKYLGVAELAHLSAAPLAVRCLARVRDCFVFQCWTGLAYADLAALNVAEAEYHKDARGNLLRVLRVRRAKSTMQHGYECVIPLLSEAERVLALYDDKLPVPTNQVYNRYLKQIGELCGIDAAKMTSHVGRKTAGTLLLNLGVPLPVISKVLGHSNTLITQKLYAKLLDTTVVDAFGTAFAGLGNAQPAPYELSA